MIEFIISNVFRGKFPVETLIGKTLECVNNSALLIHLELIFTSDLLEVIKQITSKILAGALHISPQLSLISAT